MPKARKHKVLRIIIFTFLFIIAGVGCYGLWLSQHYRHILIKRIPEMVVKSSDSLYHVTFKDIKVNVFRKWVVVSGVHLWADTNQANILRNRGHYSPNTVSYVDAPRVEVYGIRWDNILSSHSFDCNQLIVRDPKWFMLTVKHHPDMTKVETEKKSSLLTRMAVDHFSVVNPSVTYHYVGEHTTYYCYLKGGQTDVYNWSVDRDLSKDTAVFLYGRNGSVRPASFTVEKGGRSYEVHEPVLSFTTTPTGIVLKDVKIMHLSDIDGSTGHKMEVYNLRFPSIEFENFNWKRLLHGDELVASRVNAAKPYIEVHYQRAYFPKDNDKTGDFPNQLIHRFIQTDIKSLHVKGGTIVYNEPGKNNNEAVFQFDNISGTISNITNMKGVMEQNSNCTIKLESRFMHKSPVGIDMNLSLTDPRGHFSVSGYVNDLDGSDVNKQASEFTFAKVTAFHLSHMEGHMEGNESACSGNFTMLYTGLNMSFFNSGSEPKDKGGPLSFLADKLVLYPSNPMPGEPVRSAAASVHRDAGHGLIYLIWQNVYQAAQKTVVRDNTIAKLAAAKAGDEPKPKKKGFFHRLFHWKK